jgi:hypothetical protein
MNFQAYCFKCEKRVTALSVLSDKEFWSALDKNAEIWVMHRGDDGDHRWKLIDSEKENLRRKRTEGHI